MTERLQAIAEKQFPFPEKCCAATRAEIIAVRKMRVKRLTDQLAGLTPEEIEQKLNEWEQ